jgi:RNA polymerase primary sigma factor
LRTNRSALSDYLKLLYEYEPLSQEEEINLSERIHSGDMMALEKLVTHNLRFVVSTIKATPMWQHSSVPMEDLLGFGNEELINAAKKWKPKNNARFVTYAKKFIIRGVNRAVANTSNLIRLPVNWIEEIRRMKYAERLLSQELGRVPTSKELADKMGVPVKQINHVQSLLLKEPISLDVVNNDYLRDNEYEE